MTNAEKLHTVPLAIRTWFWSDEMDQIVDELRAQFSIPENDNTLPRLLFDVEVRDLELDRLETELVSRLGLSAAAAKTLYGEIKRRVFQPLAREFVRFGIGASELSGFVISAPAAAARPDPVMAGIAPSPAPAAAPAAVPQPVSLYRDTLASQTVASTAGLGSLNTGNIAASVSSAPAAPRAARIDLGIPQSPRAEKEFRSIFVERTLPKQQTTVNYGAPAVSAPVPLASAPASIPDAAPFVPPSIEVVSVPAQASAPDAQQTGFFGSLMHRVAPWHSTRFRRGKPLPSVDYADSSLPAAPAPADLPKPASIPLDDTPAPPAAPQA